MKDKKEYERQNWRRKRGIRRREIEEWQEYKEERRNEGGREDYGEIRGRREMENTITKEDIEMEAGEE